MTDNPRIVLFTGDGKGKTTAALGMVLRAVGHGLATAVVQFIKNDPRTGELVALDRLGVDVFRGGCGLLPAAESPQFASHREAARGTLAQASTIIESGRYDMIVLDEVCTAVARGLLEERDVLAALEKAEADCVLALTGRDATDALCALADTVSEIHCQKHGHQTGMAAQKGVEF